MSTKTRTDSVDRQPDVPDGRSWGFYVLSGYPVVFLLGLVATGIVFLTTSDPSLYSSGLTAGFIVVGLSALALVVYPAYRAEANSIKDRGGSPPSVRRFAAIGLGVPLGLGFLFELVGFGMSGDVNVPGFMAGFAALVIHPFVVAVMSTGYFLHRRRWSE